MNELSKKQKIELLLKKNILISPELLEELDSFDFEQLAGNKTPESITIMSREVQKATEKASPDFNWTEFEQSKAMDEKGEGKRFASFVEFIEKSDGNEKPKEAEDIRVMFSYSNQSRHRTFEDFSAYFTARYKGIEKILKARQELRNVVSISKLKGKKEKGVVSIIGMVREKQLSKNGNILLTMEDPTGVIKAVINKNNSQFQEARDIVLDEVIGVIGMQDTTIIFANKVIWPDVPSITEMKKAPYEAYAAFLSDVHAGSKKFMPDEFSKFAKWSNCMLGSEKQREIAKKTKYVFITGDLVDGVGIYPEQASELEIKDIHEQYKMCAELIKEIRSDIKIIICPGNHDAMRISEPQPRFSEEFATGLLKLPNVTCVSNPAIINFGAAETFPGFNVLMYHGYSFDYYITNVNSIRKNGGYDRADLVMKFLLQRRHLAPTYGSTLAIPDAEKDNLVIEEVPDFFVTGHLHKCAVANYKSTTMICGSCWQAKTLFQEKTGHRPEPARVPVINLQTRQATILKFGK